MAWRTRSRAGPWPRTDRSRSRRRRGRVSRRPRLRRLQACAAGSGDVERLARDVPEIGAAIGVHVGEAEPARGRGRTAQIGPVLCCAEHAAPLIEAHDETIVRPPDGPDIEKAIAVHVGETHSRIGGAHIQAPDRRAAGTGWSATRAHSRSRSRGCWSCRALQTRTRLCRPRRDRRHLSARRSTRTRTSRRDRYSVLARAAPRAVRSRCGC